VATLRRKTSVMNHPVVITFLILAVITAMSLAAEVLKPLALSVLLAFALTPPAYALERRGLPRAAAVALTVLLTLAALGGVGFVVGRQLESLANRLPGYQNNIEKKLRVFQPNDKSAIAKAKRVASDVAEKLYTSPLEEEGGEKSVAAVRVVQQPTYRERLQTAVGPYLEFFGVGSFVLILVMFMLMSREDLRDRIVSLFGHSRVSLTTRTMDEIGQRISRYLATFAMVNSGFGLVIGLGLWAIGVRYAVLWGCLAAILRFIPYVGPAVAFVLPLTFSFAHFEGWREPLLVVALFAVVETALNSFLEPVIYGKTTGVSALGLLVAAMFWTWLWGALGLLLSTPLTVCLAVLGKYVPALKVFATFLGEEAPLKPDVRFYQRLLARDQDGATTLVDEALKEVPRAKLFDEVFIPTLAMAERDAVREDIDERERDFIWWVVDEIVQDLESTPPGEADLAVPPPTAADKGLAIPEPASDDCATIVGVPSNDKGDLLALKMLRVLLNPSGCRIELADPGETPLNIAERLVEKHPTMILISHLPPAGLTQARYLVRRLRARFPDVPILVGRWSESDEGDSADRLTSAGATQVVASLGEARDRILGRRQVKAEPRPMASQPRLPEPVVA
jgi:predicted PurR-regulated permease PerM